MLLPTLGCSESNHISFPQLANQNSASIFWKVFKPLLQYGDSSNHSFAFICAPCMNDRTIKIIACKQAINYSSVLLLQLSEFYEISSSSSKQVEQMKNENGRFGDPLVQYAGESPMTSRMSTALKTSSQIGPIVWQSLEKCGFRDLKVQFNLTCNISSYKILLFNLGGVHSKANQGFVVNDKCRKYAEQEQSI